MASSDDEGGRRSKTAEVHTWLQALFDESPMAIGFSRDGLMLDANPSYVVLFGYDSVAELRGRSILEQIAPSHRAQVIDHVGRRARGEEPPLRYETRGLRKDGTEFPFEIVTTRVIVADGPLTIAFISDLTEREKALDAVRASEERFRTLSGAALEGVFVHGDGKILVANEAGAAMYGFDPASIVGVSVLDLTAPESRAAVLDNVRRGTTEPYEGVARRKDGSTFIAEVRGRVLSHQGHPARVALIRDVTAERRAEAEQQALAERVRHAQKLESLGVLAGGVAHDFNNILTVIANSVALARQSSDLGPDAGAHLGSIALAAERAADLCRQMLAYSGKAAFVRESVDLSALVAEMTSMLEVSVPKKATLVRALAPDLPTLFGDATQIRQVVMNLVINAAEALERPGSVSITTGAGVYDAEAFARSAAGGEPKAGRYVFLEVRDDGIGMDEATAAQMFDPFFTTKFVGRGLGMAAVLGIVRGHAGAIDVESRPNEGTRIRVFFPALERAVERPRELQRSSYPRSDGVVLLVDDEKNIRISTRMLLEGFGFEVIVASDGVEAVQTFREHAGRISAVLLDRTMPRMAGIEALRILKGIAPKVPIVLTSGYGFTDEELGPEAGGADAVLAKPYSAEQLFSTVERLMSAAK